MSAWAELLVGLGVLVGVVGAVIQVYPGPLVVLVSIAGWAWGTGGSTAWLVLAVAALWLVSTGVGKYLLMGRRTAQAGVSRTSLVLGGGGAVIGFLIVPVVGLPLGFVLGVYVSEYLARRDQAAARAAAWAVLKAQGWAVLLELDGCLLAAVTWGVGLLLT